VQQLGTVQSGDMLQAIKNIYDTDGLILGFMKGNFVRLTHLFELIAHLLSSSRINRSASFIEQARCSRTIPFAAAKAWLQEIIKNILPLPTNWLAIILNPTTLGMSLF
jgi:hypothetical protein